MDVPADITHLLHNNPLEKRAKQGGQNLQKFNKLTTIHLIIQSKLRALLLF